MCKLLSVILCVYNTEQYLRTAIDSILANTYKNIEIIVVNDGSSGKFEDIVLFYKNNKKIKFVYHKNNMGLFRARITGYKNSKGEYIAFMDPDDTVSIDWYRALIKKLESENADMVIGDFNLHYDNRESFYARSIIRKSNILLSGKEVQDTFFQQAGLDYSWHVIWNKVYTKKLIKNAITFLDTIEDHIVMCEDVLFSCIFYMKAKKVTNIHYNYYYYNKSINSSTNDYKNYKKHVDSIIKVFFHIKKIFYLDKEMCKYKKYIELWEDRLLYSWKNVSNKNTFAVSYIKSKMNNPNRTFNKAKEEYYYCQENITQNYYENIKKSIVSCDIISFDIFDTLLVRPFWLPSDLFCFLEEYVNKRVGSIDNLHFKSIRIEAEKNERHKSYFKKNNQEISLDDIYEQIGSMTCFDQSLLDEIKAKEIELELKYLSIRKSGYELYSMAKHIGKKIIFTSDMYLPREVLQAVLKKNGYSDYDDIFVSSELKFTKYSGELYRYIIKKYEGCTIVHIGDNYHSDVDIPRKLGIVCHHLPRAVDVLDGKNTFAYSGTFFSSLLKKPFGLIRTDVAYAFLGFRCALAIIANRIFDNPFALDTTDSDFNCDTDKIGYSILGMYILGNCISILKFKHEYNTFIFYARNGYLVKKAFDLIINSLGIEVNSKYACFSRKASLPLFVQKKEDIYSLIKFFGKHDSIEFVLQCLSPLSKYSLDDSIIITKQHIDYDISEQKNFIKFLTFFANNLYSQKNACLYKRNVGIYFDKICIGKCLSYDVGYSFRGDYLLRKIYGYNITPSVVHIIGQDAVIRTSTLNINSYEIINYTPLVTGMVRETICSECGPSCIGYDNEGTPIKESFLQDLPSHSEILNMQNAAIQFINDFLVLFSDKFDLLCSRPFDFILPFEIYNIYSKFKDRKWAEIFYFEDLLGEGTFLNMLDFWNRQTAPIQYSSNISNNCIHHIINLSFKQKLFKVFIKKDRDFIKYYSYKLLLKISSGKIKKRALSRMHFYRAVLLGKYSN